MRPASASAEDPFLQADELRHRLREQARAARRALDEPARQAAAIALLAQLRTLPAFDSARRVAAYAAVASELSLQPLIDAMLARGQQVFLPHVEQHAPQMHFAPWNGDARRLKTNHFGIAEPMVDAAQLVAAATLDLILLPLLAFDRRGGRLGSGAGFYDRALAFRLQQPAPPLLVGVGHACQEVTEIPAEPWDVPLDAVVTDRELIICA